MLSTLLYTPVIQQLEEVAQNLLASAYLTAAAAVILLYDLMLTLPDEIEYVWSSPFSVASTMFYLNRYVPIPVMLFGVFHLSHFHNPQNTTLSVQRDSYIAPCIDSTIHLSCQVAILIQPIGEAISYLGGSWLLMLRVIALYKRRRSLVFLLYGLFATTHVVALALILLIMIRIWPSLQYSQTFGVCTSDGTIRNFSMVYFILLPFEVVLIILQIYHLSGHRHVVKLSRTKSSILTTVYLDGSIYFIIVFCLRLWAGFIYAFADASLFYIATWTEFAFSATTVSRLFLRLRRNARAVEGDFEAEPSITEPFSLGFGIHTQTSTPSALPSLSGHLPGKRRVTSLSSILSLESFWTKGVMDIRNDSGDVAATPHVNAKTQSPSIRPELPLPPIPSRQSLFVNARRPSYVRSAAF